MLLLDFCVDRGGIDYWNGAYKQILTISWQKLKVIFNVVIYIFFDARVFLFFSVGSEERFENWKVATKRLNRSGRRASAISAKHFWLVLNFKKIFIFFFIEILVQVGASINICQAFSIIFQYVEKNAFWFQSWSFNTSQAFSISFYSALTGKSLADL